MRTGLILVGHGSHISSETAGLVWTYVDTFRARGVADEITAAFWKEMPSFHNVLHTLVADDITIVPLFTARGFFTQSVILAEMRLTGSITEHEGRIIRYTKTLGEHPYLGEIVYRRVKEAVYFLNAPPQKIAIALIGHSTRRHPESREATEQQTENLRLLGIVSQVQAVYLDDAPKISDIYQLTDAPYIIAVPFFLALGSHTTIDVPRELSLPAGETFGQVHGRTVYYTPPVGADDGLRQVIIELARESGTPLRESNETGSVWACFPSVGCEQFAEEVRHVGKMRFGDLQVSPSEIRIWGDEQANDMIDTPAALRARVREQPFRSLATAKTLPNGWRVEIKNDVMLYMAVETVYPGAIADWANGQTRAIPLSETLRRQIGNYRKLVEMDAAQQENIVQQVCGGCIKNPLWHGVAEGDIPCTEACNHWLSAALETIK